MEIPSTSDITSSSEDSGRAIVSGQLFENGPYQPVRKAAFWAAVVLPFLHLPLLATGLESESVTLAFVVLLLANVVALIVGHSYRND